MLRHFEYEEALNGRLSQYRTVVHSADSSQKSREKARSEVRSCQARIRHYCLLVYWAYGSSLLSRRQIRSLLGPEFMSRSVAELSTNVDKELEGSLCKGVTWSNVDEKLFGLCIRPDNIPAVLKDCAKVKDAADECCSLQTRGLCAGYARLKVRLALWKFKVCATEELCRVLQEELRK